MGIKKALINFKKRVQLIIKNYITPFLVSNLIRYFYLFIYIPKKILSSTKTHLVVLYLISITSYAKLMNMHIPKLADKVFKYFIILKYLNNNKVLSYIVTNRTMYGFAFLNRYFPSIRKHLHLADFALYNLNFLLILDSFAALIFSWWQIFFDQENSPFEFEKHIVRSNIKVKHHFYSEFVLLTIITTFYMGIFVCAFVMAMFGKRLKVPIIAKSAVMWTLYDLRFKRQGLRY